MNGWLRMGIVLSALWLLIVGGYAAYERALLPIKIVGEETENPGPGFALARELRFVDISSGSRDVQRSIAAAQRAMGATSDRERNLARVEAQDASVLVFSTEFKEAFWLWLLIPLAAFWAAAIPSFLAWRWVVAGFKGGSGRQ